MKYDKIPEHKLNFTGEMKEAVEKNLENQTSCKVEENNLQNYSNKEE